MAFTETKVMPQQTPPSLRPGQFSIPQQTQMQFVQAPVVQKSKKNSVSFDLNPECPSWTPGRQQANPFPINVGSACLPVDRSR